MIPNFGPMWLEVPGSVPVPRYAAGMGQERLSERTAKEDKTIKMEDCMREKLQPIERRPDGSLPSMTPGQRRGANALIRTTCCNYDNGNCILLDDGEECVCVQSISYSVCCTWFRWAVLPQDKVLEAEIFHDNSVKRCTVCGAAFVPGSNRAKYCETCAKRIHRKQKNASGRKRCSKEDN